MHGVHGFGRPTSRYPPVRLQRRNVERLLRRKGADPDAVDLCSLMDGRLTLRENIAAVEQEVGPLRGHLADFTAVGLEAEQERLRNWNEAAAVSGLSEDDVRRIAREEAEKAGKSRVGVGPIDPKDWEVKPNHSEIERRVAEMLDEKRTIGYDHVAADEWLSTQTHLSSGVQWLREVRQFLVKPGPFRHYPPHGPGWAPIRQFKVPRANGRWYIARTDSLHCAVEVACREERISERRIGQVVRRLREEIGATDAAACSLCRGAGFWTP